jgi:hypothetical protein
VTAGAGRTWQVVGPDDRPHGSARPGMLGGGVPPMRGVHADTRMLERVYDKLSPEEPQSAPALARPRGAPRLHR